MNPLTDVLLEDVALAQNGSQDAFGRIVKYSANAISSISLAITKDLAASEEVTQQTFIKAWQEIKSLKNPNSLMPWLRQITRYAALDYLRANKRTRDNANDCLDNTESAQHDELLNKVCNEDFSPDNLLFKEQQTTLIKHLLSQLEPELHEIVLLYYREENSSRQVAELLDLTPANVRKKLERARSQLKEQALKQYGQVVYSSAPAGMAAIVLGLISHTAPVTTASATAASVSVASQGSAGWLALLSKYSTFIGTFFFATIIALLANDHSMRSVIKNIKDKNTQKSIKRIGNQTAVIIVLATFIMAIGYISTDGWLVPTLGFVCLSLGLIRSTVLVIRLTGDEMAKGCFGRPVYGYFGLICGLLGGGTGLVTGLYFSGRFAQLW